jgi:DNA-binding XRE family transcriptional regulator
MSKAEQVSAKKREGTIRKMNRGGSGRKLVWNCKLHEMRDRLNLTLRDIESQTGVSSANLSTIEYGTDPQLTTAVAIADFFGVSVAEMWPSRRIESVKTKGE